LVVPPERGTSMPSEQHPVGHLGMVEESTIVGVHVDM